MIKQTFKLELRALPDALRPQPTPSYPLLQRRRYELSDAFEILLDLRYVDVR